MSFKMNSVVVMTLLASSVQAGILPADQASNSWFIDAQEAIATKQTQATSEKAKNVILFVGDGMGISTLTAARILDGQNNGMDGEENALSFETFPYSALVKTYNVDAQTPDSAGTMTAMMSGLKTDVGVIGVDEDIERGDCATVSGNEVVTALELAEVKGLSTGIISTARITHATPAATYAHAADRNWEDDGDMSTKAKDAGCKDIADQLVNFEPYLEARYNVDVDGIEVVMGGGRRSFLPKDAAFNSADAVSAVEGDRTDGRDLTAEWQAKYTNGEYVIDQSGFDAIDADSTDKLFGLFNESHMQYEADRENDVAGEPSLSDMTETAINILDNNEKGFFLMVESGRIDHAHHAGNAYNALNDAIELSKAVQAAVDSTNPEETLILVTADHGHVFTIAGYPKRGNPILGKVVSVGATEPATASDGMPYTTLGYTNGLGFRDLGDETDADASYASAADNSRYDLTAIDTTSPGYHQEAVIPLGSETHSGEDIALHAKGPSAQMAQGVVEQNMVFHIINNALALVKE
ncbi:alkaline phosphatase [Thalassolituus oleivorans]|jgi:alkaline phosphatase|uniref:alkaline phosphatase n=1 Tax=Thalassolituus oleivorans TaxID=187493 RepID=UPI0009493AD7|nr:alkaline phosphatase [Thalassolituus oleivorans]APR68121.1 alkaline phosphatase [Thalassolituus oleivorans]